MSLFQYIKRGIAWPDAGKELQSYVELRDRELEQYLKGLPQGNVAYAYDSTPRDSAVGGGASLVVFPTLAFTPVVGRLYKVSWSASYVANLSAAPNQYIVQFANAAGTVMHNAAIGVMTGSFYQELNGWIPLPGAAWAGTTGVKVLCTASAAAAFRFQNGGYGSSLQVEDQGIG